MKVVARAHMLLDEGLDLSMNSASLWSTRPRRWQRRAARGEKQADPSKATLPRFGGLPKGGEGGALGGGWAGRWRRRRRRRGPGWGTAVTRGGGGGTAEGASGGRSSRWSTPRRSMPRRAQRRSVGAAADEEADRGAETMQEKEAGPVEGDGAALSGEGEGEEDAEEAEAAAEEGGNEGDAAGTRATSATTTGVLTPSLPGGGAADGEGTGSGGEGSGGGGSSGGAGAAGGEGVLAAVEAGLAQARRANARRSSVGPAAALETPMHPPSAVPLAMCPDQSGESGITGGGEDRLSPSSRSCRRRHMRPRAKLRRGTKRRRGPPTDHGDDGRAAAALAAEEKAGFSAAGGGGDGGGDDDGSEGGFSQGGSGCGVGGARHGRSILRALSRPPMAGASRRLPSCSATCTPFSPSTTGRITRPMQARSRLRDGAIASAAIARRVGGHAVGGSRPRAGRAPAQEGADLSHGVRAVRPDRARTLRIRNKFRFL